MKKFYRQGDVYLDKIDAIPADAKPVKIKGRVVVAEGEVTGHAHAFDGAGVQVLKLGDARYVQITGKTELKPTAVLHRDEHSARIRTADGLTVRFGAGDERLQPVVDAIDRNETVSLLGRMLRHEEHDAIIALPGIYKVEHQREYHPTEIRRVLD